MQFSIENLIKCSALSRITLNVVAQTDDDQDLPLVIGNITSQKIRDEQEVTLPVSYATVNTIRDAGDLQIPVMLNPQQLIRCASEVKLVVIGTKKFPITFVVT